MRATVLPRFIPGKDGVWEIPPLHWLPDVRIQSPAALIITCSLGHYIEVLESELLDVESVKPSVTVDTGVHQARCPFCEWSAELVVVDGYIAFVSELIELRAHHGALVDDAARVLLRDESSSAFGWWTRAKWVLIYTWRRGWAGNWGDFRVTVAQSLRSEWEKSYSLEHSRLMAEKVVELEAWKFYPMVAVLMAIGLFMRGLGVLSWLGRTLIGR